ncbi:MAG: AAA family ATPase [Clostridia bacterium]|nr:AAA family ATPase [Clostridia bacterium]
MTIKKIHVESFGKLCGYETELHNGLNVIYAPNESGKSTLLSFIKFMFYGTKIKKQKDELAFKEKYMPWNGMPMGGSIEFEHENRFYVIHRMEGMKNGSKEFSIKNPYTGEEYKNIDDAGKFFFGVGEAGFSDTCFVENFNTIGSNEDLLSSLSGEAADNLSYTKAIKVLEERILIFTSLKRKDSELIKLNTEIDENNTNIVRTEIEIDSCKDAVDRLKKLKKELNTLNNDINDLNYQKKIIEEYDDYLRLRSLEESLESEKIHNAFLEQELSELSNCKTDKTHEVCTNQKTDKKNSVCKNRMKIIALLFFAMIAGIGCLKTNGLFYFMFAALLLSSVISAVILIALRFRNYFSHDNKNGNITFEPMNENDHFESLKHRKMLSDERIKSIKSSIVRIKSSETVKIIAESTDLNDINCFTNEEINDIIKSKGERKERLMAEIASLNMYSDRYKELVSDLKRFKNHEQLLKEKSLVLKNKADICRLALEMLNTAYHKLKTGFAPAISKRAFEIISSVARNDLTGVYATVENTSVDVVYKNGIKDSKVLSTATRDLVKLSVRIALCDYLGSIPMFLDDVLSSFDDERTERMLLILEKLSCNIQLVLCTCRKREIDFFESRSNVNIINMRKEEANG